MAGDTKEKYILKFPLLVLSSYPQILPSNSPHLCLILEKGKREFRIMSMRGIHMDAQS